MAEIWPVYEGRRPTQGEPWATVPLRQAIELLDLSPQDFISDPDRTPRIGRKDRDLAVFGFKHIVAEIGPKEADGRDWKPGFYRSPLSPREAFKRLLRHAETFNQFLRDIFVQELGEDNVLRVDHAYMTDSEGRPSFRISVVLAADATPKITGEATLAAFGLLQQRLAAMGVEGTPVIQYATEAELAQGDA